ncbi:MAG: class I mannose-6-phosphate isomerase [Muribaculaceae bacterium]|nr:class I mannose-6-phosphate isomerase [Muribaculaceae bacterium]
MNTLRPYKFNPIFKQVLWGGNRLAEFKSIDVAMEQVGETWEISGLPGHETTVAGGDDDGLTVSQLIERHGARLVGVRIFEQYGTTFPLLFKFIDARHDLSVQVHPDDELAMRLHGALGKTEMWYVIDALPHSRIISGLNRGLTAEEFAHMTQAHTLATVLASREVQAGDVFFLPPGRIHSIGAGVLLAEVQQASDITYRVYDYDRVDSNGRLRELHTELAVQAIDYTPGDSFVGSTARQNDAHTPLVQCEAFNTTLEKIDGERLLTFPTDDFAVMMCVDGSCQLIGDDGHATSLSRGETVLIAAEVKHLITRGCATLLATVPS